MRISIDQCCWFKIGTDGNEVVVAHRDRTEIVLRFWKRNLRASEHADVVGR